MIFIVVKFAVKPEYADSWPELSGPFTRATRDEPGNLWFDWSRSIDNPDEYVLVEAFEEGDAASVHVNSAHFKTMLQEFPRYLSSTPRIISRRIEGHGWDVMGELTIR